MMTELMTGFKIKLVIKKRLIYAKYNDLRTDLPTFTLFLKKIRLMYHLILQKIKNIYRYKGKKVEDKIKSRGQI